MQLERRGVSEDGVAVVLIHKQPCDLYHVYVCMCVPLSLRGVCGGRREKADDGSRIAVKMSCGLLLLSSRRRGLIWRRTGLDWRTTGRRVDWSDAKQPEAEEELPVRDNKVALFVAPTEPEQSVEGSV